MAGGWAWTPRRNGKNPKPRNRLENAARTHLSTAYHPGDRAGRIVSALVYQSEPFLLR